MRQDIQIRKAVKADLDRIEKLYGEICDYLELHRNYPGWRKGIYPVRQDAEEALAADTLHIACLGKTIAGSAILNHEPEKGYGNARWLTADTYTHIYVIHTLAVHPDFLKCGLGTGLLAYAEQAVREEQCISIRLDVVKGNLPPERLYQKCGYQMIGIVSLGYESYGLPWYNLYEKVL